MTTGLLIKQARGARSQREIASCLDISEMTLSYWERGKLRPSDAQLAALAEALSVPLASLQTHRLSPAAFKALKALKALSAAEMQAVLARLGSQS